MIFKCGCFCQLQLELGFYCFHFIAILLVILRSSYSICLHLKLSRMYDWVQFIENITNDRQFVS